MDPDANLTEQRLIVSKLATEDMSALEVQWAAHRLAALVEALDNWIVGGGFLPRAWRER